MILEAIGEYLAIVAGIVTSLGVIVGALYKWVWKPYAKKKEKREQEHDRNMLKLVTKAQEPYVTQLEMLDEQTKRHAEVDDKLTQIADQNKVILSDLKDEFEEHNRGAEERNTLIKQNADIIRKHEQRLDRHADRLLILETIEAHRENNKRKGEENETK